MQGFSLPLFQRINLLEAIGLCCMALSMGFPLMLQGQVSTGCLPVWQGFSLHWNYPHSIAGFGSQLAENETNGNGLGCTFKQTVTGSPGNGADSATSVGYHAIVQSGLMQSMRGEVILGFSGKEKEAIKVTEIVEANLPDLLAEDFKWEVILAGFDLRTSESVQPDLLQALDIAIDSVWRDEKAGKLKFRVVGGLQMACPTMDCELLNQVVDYELAVQWQVIGGPGFRSQRSSFGSSRDWEKPDTAPSVEPAKVVLLGDGHYRQASVGITGLHIRLDRPALMLAWDSHLECVSYAQGLLTMLLRMDFVQNQPGMEAARRAARKLKPHPSSACSIKAHPGSLVWEMEVALLQFEDGKVQSKIVR